MKHFLIFTDLDGTLLDHYSYSWDAARPALKKIIDRGFPWVLSSSKTGAEIESLRARLGNRHPFITENGGAVAVPSGYFGTESENAEPILDWIRFGPDYAELVRVIDRIRSEGGYAFCGFNDLSAAEIGRLTGLSPDDSGRAKVREASEPLVWRDSEARLLDFQACLKDQGLNLTRGGRFYHVTGQTDKAKGVQWLKQQYDRVWPERRFISIGLGDGPNDIGMLESVDIAVVIKPARAPALRLNTDNRVIYSEVPGPQGWCQALEQILGECLDG